MNELEQQKAKLEGIFEQLKARVTKLDRDIELFERLLAAKNERERLLADMQEIATEHTQVCKAIEAEAEKEKVDEKAAE